MRLARCGWITVLVLLWGAQRRAPRRRSWTSIPTGAVPARRWRRRSMRWPAMATRSSGSMSTENRELAAKFNVTAIPCFVVVERGKEVDRVVGRDHGRTAEGETPTAAGPDRSGCQEEAAASGLALRASR